MRTKCTFRTVNHYGRLVFEEEMSRKSSLSLRHSKASCIGFEMPGSGELHATKAERFDYAAMIGAIPRQKGKNVLYGTTRRITRRQ